MAAAGVKRYPDSDEKKPVNTTRMDAVADRVRQLAYVTAFVVAVGSIWTVAWADAMDARANRGAAPYDRQVSADTAANRAPFGPAAGGGRHGR